MLIRTPLYHKGRDGSIRVWSVAVEGDKIISTHGVLEGVYQQAVKKATPKNVGRANATTAEQQAMIEAQAMWTYKRDRKYSLTPSEAQEDVLLPMLAHPFEKYVKKLLYPVDVQPKLDGLRAIARWEGDKVVLISRAGKPWLVTTHLNEQLEKLMPKGTVLDGEIYLHGKPLQWITSRAKKKQEGTECLQYHVYDSPEVDGDDSLLWVSRESKLWTLFTAGPVTTSIKQVHTLRVDSRADVMWSHDKYVDEGYEGLIVRTLNGLYEYGHRSPSLLKVKAFEDAEFTIIGHTDGKGKEEGTVVWICKNDINDLTFETRPRGTYEERQKLFRNAEKYHGRKLTVRYIGRNDSGLPHHAIGHAIRLEEDL